MASIFDIKSRIKGVESTQKITKSMKLVATSKLRLAQNRLAAFKPYSDNCARALRLVLSGIRESSPLLAERPVKKVCYVVVVGDRGLCGAYNQDILRFLQTAIKKETADYCTVVCGRWGIDEKVQKELRVIRRFGDMADIPTAEDSEVLSYYLQTLFLDEEIDKVLLVYQKHSAMSQTPACFQLLPVIAEGDKGERECIFEPDRATLIETLTKMYVGSEIRRVLLEARASEHLARMMAMTSATDNADELMHDLTLDLNRTRQAKITTEISEVSGGAKALEEIDGRS